MVMKVAIYARVSTDGQSVNAQLADLRETAERRGWEIMQEYTDKGISGAKGRDQRPALDAMLKAATRREFDMVAAWSVDRLGRSLQHLVNGLNDLKDVGVGLYLPTPSWGGPQRGPDPGENHEPGETQKHCPCGKGRN